MKIPIVNLKLPESVISQAADVLRSGQWIDGSNVHKLEERFAQFCGVKYCRAVCNGTAGLMTMMGISKIGPGDEVIVPSFSFIATANCVKFVGATPVFAEIDPKTFTIDPNSVKQKITSHTKAIMPVHLYGLCADMGALGELSREHRIPILEDAAQAHGATIKSKKAGSFGLSAGFSLYPTKNMFSGGEGGLITTNDSELFNEISLYMNHGQAKKYYHTSLGFNFRMSELNAVIALYTLEQLPIWNRQRQSHAKTLSDQLSDIPQIQTPFIPPNFTHVFHQYTIRTTQRDKIITALQKEDIGFGIHYSIPIHKQPYYLSQNPDAFLPETDRAAKQVLSLPIHPALTDEQLHFIADIIRKAL
jgi:perosamine synthetase